MIDAVPAYVSALFILTTFASIAFLLQAIKRTGPYTFPAKLLVFLIPFWLFLQAMLARGDFYEDTTTVPPRLFLFAVLPPLLTILFYLIFWRRGFLERLPLGILTMLHVVRIPVEIVLLLLSIAGTVPAMMTFEGRNVDILSGLLAPIVWFVAFKLRYRSRMILIAYNLLGLALLFNVVTIAILSLPSPVQRLNFDQPNTGVLYFPYIWLPAIVVPIVMLSHVVSLYKLLRRSMPEGNL